MQALKSLFELLVLFHAVEASVIPVIERRRQAMERVLVRSLLRHAKPLMFKVTFQREEALLQLCRNIHRHSSLSTVPRKELGGNTSRGRGHTSRTYCMHSLSLSSFTIISSPHMSPLSAFCLHCEMPHLCIMICVMCNSSLTRDTRGVLVVIRPAQSSLAIRWIYVLLHHTHSSARISIGGGTAYITEMLLIGSPASTSSRSE